MQPFNHPKPQVPPHVAARSRRFTLVDSAIFSALTGYTSGALERARELGDELAAEMNRPLTADERDAEDRYRLEVQRYNEAATAHNAALKAEKQARVNARETRQVRAARCTSCFCVHAGEC